MTSAPLRLAPLDATHDRTSFNSGSEPLDRYLREHVTQDVRRRVAACFVALAEGQRIAGYYTLASAMLVLNWPARSTSWSSVESAKTRHQARRACACAGGARTHWD